MVEPPSPFHSLTLPSSSITEAALIGGMFIDVVVIDRAADVLHACDFVEPFHGWIFDVAVTLRAQGAEKVTPASVWPYLKDNPGMSAVGGFARMNVIA